MRHGFLMATCFGLALLLLRPAMPQTGGADQNSPEALKAAYDKAWSAKDWPGAVAAAQKLVDVRASAENLDSLAKAQVNARANADALATTDRALAAAEHEKPAQGQPDAAWKDMKSKILLTRGNAFLLLHREPDAIDAYNQSAALAANPSLAYFNICATLYNTGDLQGTAPACRKP